MLDYLLSLFLLSSYLNALSKKSLLFKRNNAAVMCLVADRLAEFILLLGLLGRNVQVILEVVFPAKWPIVD